MSSKFIDFIFGYEKSEQTFSKSQFAKAEKRFYSHAIGGIGSVYSKRILNSKAAVFASNLKNALAFASIKSYGILFIAFGFVTLLLDFAEYYFSNLTSVFTVELIIGATVGVIGILLSFFDKPLVTTLQNNSVTDFLLFDFLCLKHIRNDKVKEKKESQLWIPFILGVFSAILGFFTSEFIIIGIASLALFLALAFSSPEFSFMATLFALPFISVFERPTLILALLVCISAISFINKILLGKRLFYFEQYDAAMIAFMLFILISGIFNKGIVSFEKSLVLIILALAYFLANNIIVNRRIAENSVKIIIFSSIPTAIYGIVLYFSTSSRPEWIDPMFNSDIPSRAYATFANPNIYAVFLIVATVFSFAFTVDKAQKNLFFVYAIAFILNATALVLTWTRGAWIAVIISGVAFAIIRSRRTPKILLVIVLVLPLCLLAVPTEIISRFLSSFNLSDSSILSRLSIWRSSLKMFTDNIFIGIGIGDEAFMEEFLKYAEDSVTAPHSHNLFLELGCEVGIFALVIFILMLVIRTRHRASYAKYVRNSSVDNLCTISGTAIFSLLIFGMTDYIWYSSSMYFLFWVIFGIGSATLRISKKEYDESIIIPENDEFSATANVNI